MSITNAWLFPGQGSQYPSMGRSVWNHQSTKSVFDTAESISGLPLRQVMANGPADQLRRPEYLEPSTAALQIACVLLARENGLEPAAIAGYSLGEIGALYCAGCLSIDATLTLAAGRGKILEQQASGAWRSLALSFRQDAEAVPICGFDGVFTAAYNSPRDFTVTGEETHVRALEADLRRFGASLSPVAIDGPWHSPLAASSARATLELLKTIKFKKPLLPICLGSIGRFETDVESLRASLARGIQTPILWAAATETLWQAGVQCTLEMAPGRILTGYLRNNWRDRTYLAQFMEREGGRPFDFAAFRKAQAAFLEPRTEEDASWKKLA